MRKKDKHQTPIFLPPSPRLFTLLSPNPLPTLSSTVRDREQCSWNRTVSLFCYPTLVQALPIGELLQEKNLLPCQISVGIISFGKYPTAPVCTGCSDFHLGVFFRENINSNILLHKVKGSIPSLRDFTTDCTSHSLFSDIGVHTTVYYFCVPSSSVCMAFSDLC